MTLYSENLNMLWGSLLVEELVRSGVKYFCISPGSRSAPLTIAAGRNPRAGTRVCYDERGAAFHALGYARAAEKPAAVITTSGTALANCLPAVAEASVDGVPLLILSADRPPELLDCGANQTMPQMGLFDRFTRWSFDLPAPDEKISPRMLLSTVDQAIFRATGYPGGPVHLNCRFREPLEPTAQPVPEEYLKLLGGWPDSGNPWTTYPAPVPVISETGLAEVRRLVSNASRGLLSIGRLRSEEERQSVRKLVQRLDWPVVADIASGLRLDGELPNLIPHFDLMLASERLQAALEPDLLLHIGAPPTSKRFLQFTENQTPEAYIWVESLPDRRDALHGVTHRVATEVPVCCRALEMGTASSLLPKLKKLSDRVAALLDEEAVTGQINTLRRLSRLLSADGGLFLGSSLTIREMDSFAAPATGLLPVGCNRGISGIDGTIASAAGFATGLRKPVTLVLGDIAFLHDLNSLHLLNRIDQPVIVVLVNNDGGGIFSLLPVAGYETVFEEYFGTPHGLSFRAAAEQFGLPYYAPANAGKLETYYNQALGSGRSAVIEIQSDREDNARRHREILRRVKELADRGAAG